MAKQQGPRSIEEFVDDLPEKFATCREMFHDWRPYGTVRMKDWYERTQRCVRCGSRREVLVSFSGSVLTRHIDYADGYLATGLGHVTGGARDYLRLHNIQNELAKSGNQKVKKLRRVS